MTALQLRKRLLLAETELRRRQLRADLEFLRLTWRGGAKQTRNVALVTVVGWSLLKLFRGRSARREPRPRTRIGRLAQMLPLLFSAWKAFRSAVASQRT
ncbi:MAG: hypothetical protein J0M24_26665 [Verrucomicrobia bacterium]|nr:hypothetical protein [Verrucomicrobiota bacterium]